MDISSNRQRLLACPAVVSLNEAQMLAAVAAIPYRQLRSGRVRALPTPPQSPVVLPSPEPESNGEEMALESMPSSPARDQQLAGSPLFVDSDDEFDWEFEPFFSGFPFTSPSSSLSPEPFFPPVRSPLPAPSASPDSLLTVDAAADAVPASASPAPPAPPMTPERAMPPPPTPQDASVRRVRQIEFNMAQLADQARVLWLWSPTDRKTDKPYVPTAVGKWWYD